MRYKLVHLLAAIAFLTVTVHSSYGQRSVPREYQSGYIHTKTHNIYKARDIKVLKDDVVFQHNGSTTQFDLNDLKLMKLSVGNESRKGIIYGLGTGAAISLLGVLNVASDNTMRLRDDAAIRIAGLTLGSGLIGGIIGLGIKKYKSIYDPVGYFNRREVSLALTDSGIGLVINF